MKKATLRTCEYCGGQTFMPIHTCKEARAVNKTAAALGNIEDVMSGENLKRLTPEERKQRQTRLISMTTGLKVTGQKAKPKYDKPYYELRNSNEDYDVGDVMKT